MSFISEDEFLKINAVYKLRKTLQRRGRLCMADAYRACGTGLTIPEFEVVVQMFVDGNICTRTGRTLIFNPDVAQWEKKMQCTLPSGLELQGVVGEDHAAY